MTSTFNKKLYNIYRKKLHWPKNPAELYSNLDELVIYLRYLRDYHILNYTEPLSEEDTNIINTLHAAIYEYNDYKNCMSKYYKIENGVPVNISGFSDAAEKFAAEKSKHWQNIWSIIAVNAESWFESNESSFK